MYYVKYKCQSKIINNWKFGRSLTLLTTYIEKVYTIMHQVKKTLYRRYFLTQFLRHAHCKKNSVNVLYPMESKKLLRISGVDAGAFLQGLITNDMRHFEEGAKSMYAMFLNNKGRVLYDTLIHKHEHNNCYLIECDQSIFGLLQKHLKIYKLRRQVDINDVSSEYKLWTFVSSDPEMKLNSKELISAYKDPRLTDLGYRIISDTSVKQSRLTEIIGTKVMIENNEDGYKYLRYKLGVSEGADDLPPGTIFPLEANCDYLHGVSFHKGCYIGQELTARVHHTGVVRKRIMPIKFIEKVNEYLKKDSVISASDDNTKSNLGKLKGYIDDCGLGLLRIKESLDTKTLKVGTYSAQIIKPVWWPIEAPKDKAPIKIE